MQPAKAIVSRRLARAYRRVQIFAAVASATKQRMTLNAFVNRALGVKPQVHVFGQRLQIFSVRRGLLSVTVYKAARFAAQRFRKVLDVSYSSVLRF